MCDNTFLGYIEDRLQFNRIKVMLYEKELPYYNEKNEEIEGLDEYLDEYLREDSESGGRIGEGGIREGIRPYTDSSSLGTNGLSDFYKNNHNGNNVDHNHDHLPRSHDSHNPTTNNPPNPPHNLPNPTTNNPPNPTTNPPPFITPIHIPPKNPYNPNPPPNTTTSYTFQKTNGSLSLNLISFEMDPIFEVSRLDIYVDLKLSTSLLLVEGTGVDITFENSSEMEIFLLGPNGPVLGVLYFPCEFFVDKKSSVLELDFRNFNYLKIDVTFNKEIKLVRQDAKILYIYNEGHEFEDLYTYTPRICGVCYKFIVLLSYAMRWCGGEEEYKHKGKEYRDNDDYNEDPLFNDHKVNGQRNLVSKDRSFEKEEKKLLKDHININMHKNTHKNTNGPDNNNNPPISTTSPTTPPNQITDLIALKILRKDKIVNISDVAYIEVERKVLEMAAYYKHPFLMKMYFCFQDSKALYFGCEYLAGGDLFTHTVRNSFGLKDILLYASEILLALDFLHNKHYIYRDLKLDNILVGEDGHVKICDFGLCKEGIGPLAHTYTYCGTLNTIAPEIIRGEPYTKAVDWWSYGVVLYELYERRPPFTGATSSELSRNILENKPEFSKTPEDAKKLIKKLLCSEPEERYGFGPNGVELIKNHEYFKEINWKDVYEKKITPEFKPGNIHSQFEGNSREETVIASPTTTNCDYDQYFLNFK
ncbi:Protein kinase C-like protein, partial [Nosema bombycis CQ1]